jgi:hypothetical protein
MKTLAILVTFCISLILSAGCQLANEEFDVHVDLQECTLSSECGQGAACTVDGLCIRVWEEISNDNCENEETTELTEPDDPFHNDSFGHAVNHGIKNFPLVVTATWDQGNTTVDVDLHAVKYRTNGTFAYPVPSIWYSWHGVRVNDIPRCEKNTDCLSGENCLQISNSVSLGKTCVPYSDDMLNDSCDARMPENNWAKYPSDPCYGPGPEAVFFKDPEPGDRFRIVVEKFAEYVNIPNEGNVTTPVPVTVSVFINGQKCEQEVTFDLIYQNEMHKILDITWAAQSCDDIEILALPAVKFEGRQEAILDPLNNGKSIWCDWCDQEDE